MTIMKVTFELLKSYNVTEYPYAIYSNDEGTQTFMFLCFNEDGIVIDYESKTIYKENTSDIYLYAKNAIHYMQEKYKEFKGKKMSSLRGYEFNLEGKPNFEILQFEGTSEGDMTYFIPSDDAGDIYDLIGDFADTSAKVFIENGKLKDFHEVWKTLRKTICTLSLEPKCKGNSCQFTCNQCDDIMGEYDVVKVVNGEHIRWFVMLNGCYVRYVNPDKLNKIVRRVGNKVEILKI